MNTPDYDSIKNTISISDVLSRYVSVPNRSKYRIPCPIHLGEGYNFGVDNTKGLFHCFVCEAAGDVIKLYSLLENITNGEAARRLAFEFNVRPGENVPTLRRVMQEASNYQPHNPLPLIELPESQPLEGYRRLSKEAIEHFGLRLHPEGVLIPFRDWGGIVGYSIRQINKLPKYKNMTDFKKSEYVYGLWENDQYIAATKKVLICEGPFDAIRVWDGGWKNVVATLGASMSPTQANILCHWVSKVFILYDGDDKGRSAASQIKDKYSSLFDIQIITLPEGEEPDTADLKSYLHDL